MTATLSVHVPGPWWHALSYLHETPLREGLRVLVPVGRGKRIGFVGKETSVFGDGPLPGKVRLRSVEAVLDDVPSLGWELWHLTAWMGTAFFCGMPLALSVVSPAFLMKREIFSFPEMPLPENTRTGGEEFVYREKKRFRFERYIEILGRNPAGPSGLALFSEEGEARDFWTALPESMREKGVLWPSLGGKRLAETWRKVRSGETTFVVGARGAVFAPLFRPEVILVDEEASGGHIGPGTPAFHVRTVAFRRAQLWKSLFLLGGRMPSSRVFLRGRLSCSSKPGKRLIFVDVGRAKRHDVTGVEGGLRLSGTLVRRTFEAVSAGKVALWLLDRKGYAGEVVCDQCGRSFHCPRCGTVCRVEGESLHCFLCGEKQLFPRECPACRNLLLVGKRPGLEALLPIAERLWKGAFPVRLWHSGLSGEKRHLRALLEEMRRGGLVVGTRYALQLCDALPVGCVSWIDADGEARRPFYDARFQAFKMVWESCWRGEGAEHRLVVVQSRNVSLPWLGALKVGWDVFWRRELQERKDLNLPPWTTLLCLELPETMEKERLVDRLEAEGFAPLDPDPSGRMVWLRVQEGHRLFRALFPLFHLQSRQGDFPRITLWRE